MAFTALIIATVIAVLDISAVNLALPSIADGLGLSVDQALWLSKANLLACAVSILPFASLGDSIGHRRLLTAGLTTFAATAIGTALGSDLAWLVTLRAVQGCAGAAIMCSTLVLMREIFPANMLGSALGINALFVALATTTGPVLTGTVLSVLSWRWLFGLSPLLALIALTLGLRHLPEKRVPNRRFDLTGSLLLVGGATIALLWHLHPRAEWLGGASLLTVWLFFVQQRQIKSPILPLRVFTNLRFDYALVASVIAFIGQTGVFVAIPLVLQQNMGFTPIEAAALTLPWPLMTAIFGPFAGKYADLRSPRVVASVGLTLFACGLAALALLNERSCAEDIAWRMALCGIGFGLFQSPNNREILTNVVSGHAAQGAALLCTARLVGQALGAALVIVPSAEPRDPHQSLPAELHISGLLWSNAALQLGMLVMGALLWAFALRNPARSHS